MLKIISIIVILLLTGCASGKQAERNEEKRIEKTNVLTEELPPVYTEVSIGEANTPLLDDSTSRVENINIACGAINGTVLEPGGSFSFNTAVGRRTEDRGYSDAPVLVDGHKEKGCGGGVCQVSSTLYMAALNAGLSITERHAHSEGVAYAPRGKDATVVYGEKDLCFTNSLTEPVTLYVWTDGATVFSKITQKVLDKKA
ncbi:MAG: VanW family protein [Oscillospiraceae bacterium]|nr:VanW family protein [Oscillospiraceae bacterium]